VLGVVCIYVFHIKKNMKTKFVIICFIFVGFIIGLFGYQDSYITSLSETSSLSKTKNIIPILPTRPYEGTFTATHDRLGIVKVRLSTGGRINTNSLIFRLREKGSEKWNIENTYVTDRFIDGGKYPFGFPIISDSQGKTFEYELSTIDGTTDNTVSVLPGMYAFQTDYIYSQSMLRADKNVALWFLKQKGKELFGTFPHIGYWIMCFLPILFFTKIYFVAWILIIILYMFLPMQIHSNMLLWFGFSTLGMSVYTKNYFVPFVLALLTFIVFLLSYLFGVYYITAKAATIIFILLTSGGIATLVSTRH